MVIGWHRGDCDEVGRRHGTKNTHIYATEGKILTYMQLKAKSAAFEPRKGSDRDSSANKPPTRTSDCVGSCIGCGKIYGSDEGHILDSGKCLFCKERKVFPSLRQSELSQKSLGGIKENQIAGVMRAYEVKDRLLQFDSENAKRTHVHDAQNDYYESSTWLTEEEKAAIDRKRKKATEAKKPSNRRYVMGLNANKKHTTAQTIVVTGAEDEDEDEDGKDSGDFVLPAEEMPPLNAGLEASATKAGDIYRLLADSLAPWRSERTTAL